MPKITSGQIVFLPEDRYIISEKSPGITASAYTTLFNSAIQNGETTELFKFFEEIAEKDPDILHSISTRTSYVTSKEWTVESENTQDAEMIEEALRNIKGDPTRGLITVDGLIEACLGNSYLTGLSFNEIVTDGEGIIGFNHVPSHFLTFHDSVYYPKLWTQETPTGVPFNKEKMIAHYLHHAEDPARGWLGHAIGWLYVLKRTAMDARLQFQRKYGKGFLLVNMPGDRDSYEKAWETAEDLISNYSDVDGAVFPADVMVDFKESQALDGEYFFTSEADFRSSITKVILGQESTSSAENSNRSTAEVHMEVLEQRIVDDCETLEDTLTTQLIEKIKPILGIPEDSDCRFKFGVGEMEATLDDEMAEETIEDGSPGETVTEEQETGEDVE